MTSEWNFEGTYLDYIIGQISKSKINIVKAFLKKVTHETRMKLKCMKEIE